MRNEKAADDFWLQTTLNKQIELVKDREIITREDEKMKESEKRWEEVSGEEERDAEDGHKEKLMPNV